MISQAWLQFKYYWKLWIFTLPIFIVCSFIINICLTNFFNFVGNTLVNSEMLNNTQLFFIPIFFSGIMIPIVLKNTTREILNSLRKQNNLQIILGLTPRYLATISGIELSISSAIGAVCGSLISTPFAQAFYNFLVDTQGTQQIPPMTISFSFQALIITLLLITILTFISGYIHSRHGFYKIQKNIENINIKKNDRLFPLKLSITLLINISIVLYFFSISPNKIGISSYAPMSVILIFLEIIAMSLLVHISGKIFILIFSKFFNIISNRFDFSLLNVATYSIHNNYAVFKRIYIPVIIINIFVSSFSSLLIDLPDGGDYNTRISNMVIFLGAPILITLANTICMMILLQDKETFEIKQLFVLGLKPVEIFAKKELEIMIYSISTLIISLLCNFVLSLMFVRITYLFNKAMSWFNIFLPSLLLSLAIFILMSLVAIIKIINTKWDILEFNIDIDS